MEAIVLVSESANSNPRSERGNHERCEAGSSSCQESTTFYGGDQTCSKSHSRGRADRARGKDENWSLRYRRQCEGISRGKVGQATQAVRPSEDRERGTHRSQQNVQ